MPTSNNTAAPGDGTNNPTSSITTTSSSQNADEKSPADFIIHIDPTHPSTNSVALAPSTTAHPLRAAPPAADTLTLLHTFQTALGIPSSSTNKPYQLLRPGTNLDSDNNPALIVTTQETGIWKSVTAAEQNMLWKYRYYRFIISTCLLLQILLGATLTAMGAASVSHTAITVISAITTVVAGILALLKGQGLPNRCRQDWRGWHGVRDYMEQTQGRIAAGMYTGERVEGEGGKDVYGGGLEAVWKEVRTVERMFADVGKTVDGNKPDSYLIIPGVSEKLAGKGKLGQKGDDTSF